MSGGGGEEIKKKFKSIRDMENEFFLFCSFILKWNVKIGRTFQKHRTQSVPFPNPSRVILVFFVNTSSYMLRNYWIHTPPTSSTLSRSTYKRTFSELTHTLLILLLPYHIHVCVVKELLPKTSVFTVDRK